MRVVGEYSFNGGKKTIEKYYPELLLEIRSVIESVDAQACKTKVSREKTMSGKMLFCPKKLNEGFKKRFSGKAWKPVRVECNYPTEYYVGNYTPKPLRKGAFRVMNFVKQKLGVEVQFGKYSFMVYNVAAKMTIFKNLGYIDTGVEIVPVKALAAEMSSGVSYFEQFVWDLENRGISNIDIPVLVLGIDV